MKASLKFREDQKPLVKAKIPLSILGLPFLSGISAGDAKELCLDLGTSFESGPSLKLSYRPNDQWNPFTFVVKTGVGPFGSPTSAPFSMSAEFNILGRGNPAFFLQFKPRLGDFSVKKIAAPAASLPLEPVVFCRKIDKDPDSDGEGAISGVDETPIGNGNIFSVRAAAKAARIHPGNVIDGLVSGAELSARSVLPLWSNALLKFRWGLRFPPELRRVFSDGGGGPHPPVDISLRKIPLLVMSKISIVHVAKEGKDGAKNRTGDVAEACDSVRRQLEALQAESGLLRKAVEDMKSEIGTCKSLPSAGFQMPAKQDKKKDRQSEGARSLEFGGRVVEDDVSEDMKMSLMGASGGGI